MQLNGAQREQCIKALMSAFPTPTKLEMMLSLKLDKNLHAITLGRNLKEMVFDLVQSAETEGWFGELMIAAQDSNPGNFDLIAFTSQFGLRSAQLSEPELQKWIRDTNSFFDIDKWRIKLGQIETQVCCIEIMIDGGIESGTGFLVGPDVVLTNYHVMESVIDGKAAPSDVVLRFDHKSSNISKIYNPDSEFYLDSQEWYFYKSPMAPVDLQSGPKKGLPESNQLDFILLHLSDAPGDKPIGDLGASLRKWITVSPQTYPFQPGTALFIVQHPRGLPLKLAFDTDSIIGQNANRTRVTYRTNTLKGSSGAPCFDSNWNLVALHHSGDPASTPTYNEGIPMSAIVNLLRQEKLLWTLGLS